jgi:CspA family cold shock protein
MAEGAVKWYDDSKGFGFIEREGQEDIWFHARDRSGSVDEAQFLPGARVVFTEELVRGRAKANITAVLGGSRGEPEPEPESEPAQEYTVDEVIKGLEGVFLAGLEWLDILKQVAKNGQA